MTTENGEIMATALYNGIGYGDGTDGATQRPTEPNQ